MVPEMPSQDAMEHDIVLAMLNSDAPAALLGIIALAVILQECPHCVEVRCRAKAKALVEMAESTMADIDTL